MNMHICEEVHCYKGEFSEPREAAAKNYIYSSIFYPCIYIYEYANKVRIAWKYLASRVRNQLSIKHTPD